MILKKVQRPRTDDVMEELSWLCDSLGLSSGRDTSDMAKQIVADILEQAAPPSSQEVADRLQVSQAVVNHHVRSLIQAGLLTRRHCRIHIQGGSLGEAVIEMRHRAMRILDDLQEKAVEIDDQLAEPSSK